MNYKYEVGDAVMWCGGWGSRPPKPARIVGLGEKNDEPVYDLDNGHWAYEYQLDLRMEVEPAAYAEWVSDLHADR